MKNEYVVEGKLTALDQPNTITFQTNTENGYKEVLRISKDGITANPDVPVDEAASAVLRAMDGYIKQMIQRVAMTDDEAFELIQQDYRMEEYAEAALQLIRRTEAKHNIKEKST